MTIGVPKNRLLGVALFGILLFASAASSQSLVRFGPFALEPANPNIVLLDGTIAEGAMAEFRQLLLSYPEVNLLLLNSPGGLVVEALAIADLVYNFGISTAVPEPAICHSACAYIYFAGTNRVVLGELGVHQLDAENPNLYLAQVAVAEIIDRLDRYGVDPEVRRLMLMTPPDTIHVFTPAEVEEFGLNRAEAAIGFGGPLVPAGPPQNGGGDTVVDRVALFQGLDFYGDDLDMLRVSDVVACAAACMANQQCWAFTFNTASRSGPNCFVKASTGIPDANVQAFTGLLLTRGEPNPVGFRVGVIDPTTDLLRGYDLPGGDLSQTPYPYADTQAECRLACTQNSLCRGFSYVQSNRQCWLKSSISTPVPRPGIVSGIKQGVLNYTPIEIIPL